MPPSADVPAPLTPHEPVASRAPVDLVVATLRADLEALLHSTDAAVLAERVVRLDAEGASGGDAERLDTLVTELVLHRRSWWERLARVLTVLLTMALAVVAMLLAACRLEPEVRRWVHLRAVRWPLPSGTRHVCEALVACAWLAGLAVVFLRATDAVHRARLACRVAAVHRPETWPGLCLPAPFQRLGRRFSYPGGSLLLVALGTIACSIGGWVRPGWLAWVGVVACVALGGWLVRLSLPWRRAQAVAQQGLFVERLD